MILERIAFTCLGFAMACVLPLHPAEADDPAERAAIIETMRQWEAAVEAGDFESLAGFYTGNAIYYPNGVAPIVGRERIVERNQRRGTDAAVEITQHVDDVEVNGDWAVYSCLARIEVSSVARVDPAVRHARVLLLMEKGEDGRWRIHRDIDNKPPADAATD